MTDEEFAAAEPDASAAIKKRVRELHGGYRQAVERKIDALRHELVSQDIVPELTVKELTTYEIWQAMAERHASFSLLNDLYTVEVVVTSLDEVYRTFGIFQTRFPMVPGTFADSFSLPSAGNMDHLRTVLIVGDASDPAMSGRVQVVITSTEAKYGRSAHRRTERRAAPANSNIRRAHADMLRRIRELEDAIKELRAQSHMIGHNHPDDHVSIFPPDISQKEVNQAILTLKGETPVPQRDTVFLASLGNYLKFAADRIGTELDGRGEMFIDEAYKAAGQEAGKYMSRIAALAAVAELMFHAWKSVLKWLSTLSRR
jgi:(p)ppGpp synthase/HD superfamily hydrolase